MVFPGFIEWEKLLKLWKKSLNDASPAGRPMEAVTPEAIQLVETNCCLIVV